MQQYIDKNHPLLKILEDYKSRFPIDAVSVDDIDQYLKNKNYIITGKIDGEFSLIYFNRKKNQCFLISKKGRVRTDLPLTDEFKSFCLNSGINEIIVAAELYVEEEPGKIMPYPKAISILRSPKSIEDETKIKVMIFDVISVNDKDFLEEPIFERINYIKKFKGFYFKPLEIFDTKNFNKVWKEVLKRKNVWEGVVIVFEDNKRIKVKPTLTLDLVVVGVEVSDKDKSKAAALLLSYLDDNGIFIFDSKVGSGFTDEERREWLDWAERNEVSRKGNIIYVDPYAETRIVEIEAKDIFLSEGPGMKFDKKKKTWEYIGDYTVGTLRHPVFKRFRPDKDLNSKDIRINQILVSKSSSFNLNSHEYPYSILAPRYSFICTNDEFCAKNLSNLLESPYLKIDNNYLVQIDMGNDEYVGYKPGDKIISLTKGIKGIIIDYEQIWCPQCNEKTVPLPRYNFPMFCVYYICPNCGLFMERNDVDYLVMWEEPIDEGYLYVSEVHPTEIIKESGLKPGTENDVVIKSPYGDLTKKQIYDYYNSVKNKFPKNITVFIVIMTDEGPVLRRKFNDEHITLTDEVFDYFNHGRTVEIHKVIDSKKIDYFFVDIDPREEVPFNKVKEITKYLYEYLDSWEEVESLGLQFSGNRGFYILGKLKKAYNVNELRNKLISILDQFISDYDLKNVTTGITHDPKMIRLDVSTLKYNGSIKLPYSLSYKTGLISLPLNIEDIDSFKKEDATIYKFLKQAYKDLKNLGKFKGRFVIQEHYTLRKKEPHFDLRLEVPLL